MFRLCPRLHTCPSPVHPVHPAHPPPLASSSPVLYHPHPPQTPTSEIAPDLPARCSAPVPLATPPHPTPAGPAPESPSSSDASNAAMSKNCSFPSAQCGAELLAPPSQHCPRHARDSPHHPHHDRFDALPRPCPPPHGPPSDQKPQQPYALPPSCSPSPPLPCPPTPHLNASATSIHSHSHSHSSTHPLHCPRTPNPLTCSPASDSVD